MKRNVIDYDKVFPNNKVKSQIRSSENNIGKIYTTAVELVAASSAVFLEDLVRRCVSSSSSEQGDDGVAVKNINPSSRTTESDETCNTFILTKECIFKMLEKYEDDSNRLHQQDGREETCLSFLDLQDLAKSGALQDSKILSKYGKNKINLKTNSPQKQSTVKNKKQKVGTLCLGPMTLKTNSKKNINSHETQDGIDFLEYVVAESQDGSCCVHGMVDNPNETTIIQDDEDYDD
jgi:hypothetical protein